MNEQTYKDDIIEIDPKRLLDALLNRAWIVLAASVICAVLTLVVTFLFVTPQYESSAMFYVNNSSISVGDASVSISSGDITASKSLVNTYIVILNTRETLKDVIDYAGVDLTYSEIEDMITAEAVDDTEVFRIVVNSPSPSEAERIANAIAYILPKRISSIVEGTSAKIVDAAVVPSKPSSPSYAVNTVLGFLLGLALSVSVIVLKELFDVTIRTEDDIVQISEYPVLASVPDMKAPSKGGYYHGYGDEKKTKPAADAGKQPKLIGDGISFAASEAYKLLRTKLQYSFADEKTCRIIGISSALTGEGKSLTSVNISYSLSQLGKRVLLIDCDMRRPSIVAKLPVSKEPGLSGYLAGQHQTTLVQLCGLKEDEAAFHVIASGKNPPNPVELLSSNRMSKLLEYLRQGYDYIILDLPPIGEVSDALAVVKDMDGFLLVVRKDHCDRVALGSTIRQLKFVGARILGIIFNCAAEEQGGYGKKYYKKYYSKPEKN